jgi:type IV pilus assembly protein PilA
MTNRKRQQGFSLIELLIVVAIILVISAIAVPSLMAAKRSANQSAASQTMHTAATALQNYTQTYPTVGFPATGNFAYLGSGASSGSGGSGTTCGGLTPTAPTVTAACIMDATVATAIAGGTSLNGYTFTYTGGTAGANGVIYAFTITAGPTVPGQTGVDTFYIDQLNQLHYRTDGTTAGPGDPVLGLGQ